MLYYLRTRQRLIPQLMLATLVAACGVVMASPAGAAPGRSAVPGGFASWSALYAEQVRMNAGADLIVAAGNRLADNGYAGIIAAPESRTIVLYWRGTVPASVSAVIDQVGTSTPVDVRPARYSLAEMSATTRQLLRDTDLKTSTITEVAPNVDGSGITVKAVGGRLDSTSAALAARNAMAVTVKAVAGRPTNLSRRADSSPYWGGARWGPTPNSNTTCSTGWPVWRNGRTMMLTAAHCLASGQSAYDGGRRYMGVTRDRWLNYDSMLIDASSGPYMYVGDTESFSAKPIVGVQTVYEGSWLCTSGAFSGVICDIRVSAANVWYNGEGVGYVYPAYLANRVGSNGPVSGMGDSGGPVFTLPADTSKVLAVGIITAGQWNTNTSCQGDQNRTCFSGTYFVHVYTAGDAIGFSVRTI